MAANSITPLPRWRTAGVSVTGSGHERAGLPCQDAHRYAHTPSGLFVAAVADGAGSAKRARDGANLAVQSAVGFLVGGIETASDWSDADLAGTLRDAMVAARNEAIAYAGRQGIALGDLASTLILAVASAVFVATAQIGDGAVVVGDANGGLAAVTTPDSGEFINETTFLTAPDALSRMQSKVWRGAARHVSLFSDGLQMLALRMPEAVPHDRFFLPLFRFVAEAGDTETLTQTLASFMSSGRIRERTDDDVTLVVSSYSGS